jgi:Ca-activated chloride channel family protein
MVSVTAPSLEANKRVPVQIVLVLDVSGSMGEPCVSGVSVSNTKFPYDFKTKLYVMREVANKLVEYLHDGDRISVIAFDSISNTVCANTDAKNKHLALAAISQIRPGSMTNTSSGILSGYEQVKPDFVGSTRILLMTDGHANHGEFSRDGLLKICSAKPSNTVVSTFGFGNAADQELLADMAKAGGGNYHYIESADQVRDAFAEELGGAISCVAQNIKLTIKPNKDVKVSEILNDFKVEDLNGNAVITVDDIYAGETKHILIKLSLPAVPTAKPRASTVVSLTVSWFNVIDAVVNKTEEVVKVSYVKAEDADKESDLTVAEQLAILTTAKAYLEASVKADLQDWAGAKVYCGAVEVNWKNLEARGSALASHALQNCAQVGSDLTAQSYKVSTGNSLRYASNNSLRGRSLGTAGVASLMGKGSVVEETVKDFSDLCEPEQGITVPANVPESTSPRVELKASNFVKERIRK